MFIAIQAFVGYEHVPWELAIPISGALVAAGTAFVLSRFLFTKPAAPASAPPPAEKPPCEFDPFVEGSASEQRNALRRGGSPVKVLIGNPEQGGKGQDGWVVDRSVGGLGLAVSDAIAEGSLLEVRAANAPPGTPWVEIQVKTCRQCKNGWELGCQFIKTPPWAVMLLFG
jgi:hypothetical protein